MKQVLVKQGSVLLENVPVPVVGAGEVLVCVDHSCISVGTEMSGVRASGLPLWKRALRQPENVKKAFRLVAEQGIGAATTQISEKVASANPIGYSAAGVVVTVGADVANFHPGDRVACAGAQCAFHAEYIAVPKNLTVRIDDRVSFAEASTVTLGAIALQGARRAVPTLGETFVVIGLGILGQLTAQLLRANGCRVIGVDIAADRVRLAQELGMEHAVIGSSDDVEQVYKLTGGIGADGVIITAATASDAVMSTAFQMCRKKGRVVLVGDVGLNLRRADFYLKELDFYISSSYGPGRYDEKYEEHGLDYPVGYVRWTENRNMAEYLRQVAAGQVRLGSLITSVHPLEAVSRAYAALSEPGTKPLMTLLSYSAPKSGVADRLVSYVIPAALPGAVRLAITGAGAFAKATHLPNIRAMPDRYYLHSVVSRTGHNAVATAKQFGAANATTDFRSVLDNAEVDAVLIATRHHLHADMVMEALAAGKHVLVEKPLALNRDELKRIKAFYAKAEPRAPLLLTGFNRRFSPYAHRIDEWLAGRTSPMIVDYRMNAGYIPLDHWVHGPEGGGRNRGEACHIYDLFTFLTGSEVTSIDARPIISRGGYYSSTDNFVTTIGFADGSVATLTYTALGAKAWPKEHMEIFADGKTVVMTDFRELKLFGAKDELLSTKQSDKGQREELVAFADALRNGGDWPIPLWQQLQASEIAICVDELLAAAVSNASAKKV